jgi:hypothetical protein
LAVEPDGVPPPDVPPPEVVVDELFFEPHPATTIASEITASARSANRRGLLMRTFSFLGGSAR